MSNPFRKAERRAVKLRAAIEGPTGSGKTLSALRIARGLVGPEGQIAVIDTEHGTSEKFYADRAGKNGFLMAPLTKHQPSDYVALIDAAAEFADVLIIDSLSHAWEGVLAMVDAKGGRFDAWKHVTPHHNRLVDALLTFPGHLIVTMRSKMAYEVSRDDKTGKTNVEKLGLKPVQREGLEYEFDLVMDMDQAHRLTVSKSRMSELADRSVVEPDEKFGEEIARIISVGVPEEPPAADPVEVARERYKALRDQHGDAALRAALERVGVSGPELADDATHRRVFDAIGEAILDNANALAQGVISEKDRRGLEAHAREHGLDHDGLKALARELFGVDSTKDIPADQVQALRDTIAAQAKQEAA